ncbi:MAG: hypothetical protein AAF604_23125 [Acidobacteriota bacterium]
MNKHTPILGIFYVVAGLMLLLPALLIFVATVGAGLISGDATAFAITAGVGTLIALGLAFFGIPTLIAGFALLAERPWAPTLAMIVAVAHFFNPPFGTALAIYTWWAFWPRQEPTGSLAPAV